MLMLLLFIALKRALPLLELQLALLTSKREGGVIRMVESASDDLYLLQLLG